jgi:hypothetical protein
LINTNSVIFDDETEFILNLAKKIICDPKTKNFDSKGEVFIINYENVFRLFIELVKHFVRRLINLNFNKIKYQDSPYFDPFNQENINNCIRFYSIFFNESLICNISFNNKEFRNDFLTYFSSSFTNIKNGYFHSDNFKKTSFNEIIMGSKKRDIFDLILNYELIILLFYLPIFKNQLVHFRCREFLDTLLKTYSLSLSKYFQNVDNKKELFYDKFVGISSCYFLISFLTSSNLENTVDLDCNFKNFVDLDFKPDSYLNEVKVLNKLLNDEQYLYFTIGLVNYFMKFFEFTPYFLFTLWIFKIFNVIMVICYKLIYPSREKLCLKIYNNENLFDGEKKIMQNVFSEISSDLDNIKNDILILKCVEDYFICLLSVLDYLSGETSNKPKFEVRQLMELEVYKIYLTLNNNFESDIGRYNEAWNFLKNEISCFNSYYENNQFKKQFEFKKNPTSFNESIYYSFKFYHNIGEKNYIFGNLKINVIDLDSNEEVSQNPTTHKIDEKRIMKFMDLKSNIILLCSPDSKELTYKFLYEDLELEDYKIIIDKLYENK